MKQLLMSSVLLIFIFASCNQPTPNPGTHIHEDGSVHADHTEQEVPTQESFVVTPDSLAVHTDSLMPHDQGKTHAHNGNPHKHWHWIEYLILKAFLKIPTALLEWIAKSDTFNSNKHINVFYINI